jgi:dUTP diphosphatase
MIKYHLENPVLCDPPINLRFERKSADASGYDLMANIRTPRVIEPGRRWMGATGLRLAMPRGVEAQVRTRSGLARDHGVIVLNAPGTIDADYRGEVQVCLINLGQQLYEVVPGERIAQLVFAPVLGFFGDGVRQFRINDYEVRRVMIVDDLGDTERGSSGHGSTGR